MIGCCMVVQLFGGRQKQDRSGESRVNVLLDIEMLEALLDLGLRKLEAIWLD